MSRIQPLGSGVCLKRTNGSVFQIVNGTRLPDGNGTTNWGSRHKILTPAFEVESGDHTILLFNIHSDKKRGKPIDALMECMAQAQNNSNKYTTIIELIISHKEAGPSSANWAPVFPANDPTTLMGITRSLIVWEELLENVFASQVSGIDCTLESTTSGEDFTYTSVEGVATVKGSGNWHDPAFDSLGRSIDLTIGTDLIASQSIGYKLQFSPNQDLYANINSGNAWHQALLAVGIVGIVSLLFFSL